MTTDPVIGFISNQPVIAKPTGNGIKGFTRAPDFKSAPVAGAPDPTATPVFTRKESLPIYILNTPTENLTPQPSVRAASESAAQTLSTAQTASDAVRKQDNLIAQLRQLAAQATSDSLGTAARNQLNIEFQNLVAKLNDIAGSTQFTGRSLFDGNFTLSSSPDATPTAPSTPDTSLPLPDLSAKALFDGATPDVATVPTAEAAVQSTAIAAKTVQDVAQKVQRFTQAASYTAATFESALFNHNAAASVLTEADLSARTQQLPAALLGSRLAAAGAQSRSLSDLIDLIS